MGFGAIASELKKRPNTVYYAINQWIRHGEYVDRRKNNGKHVKYRIAMHKLEDYILDNKTLEKWSGRGLQDRCLMLEKSHNV